VGAQVTGGVAAAKAPVEQTATQAAAMNLSFMKIPKNENWVF
jgi:hypothetical protein